MRDVDLYLEAHVTIEPVHDERREQAAVVARRHGFRLAHLLMQRSRAVTAERSDRDTFMTGHSKSTDDIIDRTRALVLDLNASGFQIWRYKIENTLLDSRTADVFELLSPGAPIQPPVMCDGCRP